MMFFQLLRLLCCNDLISTKDIVCKTNNVGMIALFDVECEQQRFIKANNRNADNILYYNNNILLVQNNEIPRLMADLKLQPTNYQTKW